MNKATNGVAVPLYEQVKRQISEDILQGVWSSGQVLPGEVSLAEQYSVAVGTIRRALADLTSEGMLTRRRRTGTVVTGRMPQHSLRLFYQYFRLHRSDGALVNSKAKVLSLRRTSGTDRELAAFGDLDDPEIIRIHRLRSVAGLPVMHESVAIPAQMLPNFATRKQDVPELLYVHLLEKYNIRVSAIRESVSAELASDEDRELLKLPRPAAVLVVEAQAYDQSGSLCILSTHRAATKDFRYVNEIR